jgi:hypothetical protein
MKNRAISPPNGWTFYLPQTKWVPRPNSSFQGVTEALYHHLRGNPHVLKQLGWPLELPFIAEKIDDFNAKVCEANGWTDYISTEAAGGRPAVAPFPFPTAEGLRSLRRVAAGGELLVEWLSSGAEAVSGQLSEARASVCAGCEKNEPGALSNFFTRAASESIRRALNLRREWKLETTQDEKLGVCAACLCPLRLKVHIPLDRILPKLDEETKGQLVPNCWIKTEAY